MTEIPTAWRVQKAIFAHYQEEGTKLDSTDVYTRLANEGGNIRREGVGLVLEKMQCVEMQARGRPGGIGESRMPNQYDLTEEAGKPGICNKTKCTYAQNCIIRHPGMGEQFNYPLE